MVARACLDVVVGVKRKNISHESGL
jgi:hypothetical protein